jgi:uncharacterized membrane protein YjgN (DUF898 family)
MDHPEAELDAPRSGHAFQFFGEWTEFLPIALTNLLLTIVTLGIYRFWAQARTRRYLWSRTHFIDDSFEWTGTGLEMLIGFLLVMAVLLPIFLFFNFGFQALVLRGHFLIATVIALVLYLGIFYLINLARFRALRYRLSRSFWHGIRGGSDDAGWDYAWSGIWRMGLGFLVFGLMVPWAMITLWNQRWSQMSYGPYQFEANASPSGLFGRWLLIYLAPVVFFAAIGLFAQDLAVLGNPQTANPATVKSAVIAILAGFFGMYLVILLLSLSYYAAFFRHVAGATSVAGLNFEFTARTRDWLLLILGNVALVIVTLGIGLIFLPYRNWAFAVSHLHAHGDVDFEQLTQSQTRAPGEAEGLADAFDIGAI